MEIPSFISLSEIVKSTADELRLIHKDEPTADAAVMKFTECEIELSVLAKVEADGKVKFWVVEAGGGASYENASKVTLKFTALPGNGILAAVQGAQSGPAPLPRGPEEKKKKKD
jgi:hypothetical protein